jgi:3-isopropylmalate/(R)-2-methylmalate dehydratase large subunit
VIEFTGDGVAGFLSADRMVLANMVAEAEAKTALFEIIDGSESFPQTRSSCVDTRSQAGHETARTEKPHTEYELNLATLEPLVVGPESMWTCSAVCDRGQVPVDLAYIGGCSGGQLGDFLAAASVLKGRQVVVKTVGIPATSAIVRLLKTREDGRDCTWDILESAGVQMSESVGCGACFGGFADTTGRLDGPMTCVSTLGRLSPGRLGHKQAHMYLASPLTVAASAIAGQITDPREYLA